MNAHLAGMLYEALKFKFFDDAQDILASCDLDPMIVMVIETYRNEVMTVTMMMVDYPKRARAIRGIIG